MIRHASGLSPEEIALQDAFMEGQRAGWNGLPAGLNPWREPLLPEYQEWERGRSAAEGMKLLRGGKHGSN